MTRKRITIEALVAAPPEEVWERWTEPEHIKQWNFASDDWRCPSAETDPRVGGTYKARMEAKDGSFGFDFEAVYEEVEPNKAITLAMSDGRKARSTFEPMGDSTKVTTVFDAEDRNSIETQRDGWQAILNNFKAYAERKGS